VKKREKGMLVRISHYISYTSSVNDLEKKSEKKSIKKTMTGLLSFSGNGRRYEAGSKPYYLLRLKLNSAWRRKKEKQRKCI